MSNNGSIDFCTYGHLCESLRPQQGEKRRSKTVAFAQNSLSLREIAALKSPRLPPRAVNHRRASYRRPLAEAAEKQWIVVARAAASEA